MRGEKTVLCVAAHPDDEIIGVGGTLAMHTDRGDSVHVVIMSEAEPARYKTVTKEVREKVEWRKECTEAACRHLGVESVQFYDFPDNKFDAVPLLDIVRTIEDEIRRLKPDVIYTHHYGDLNINHERVCRAVITATRPLPDCGVERVLAYETLSTSEWSTPRQDKMFTPTVFVDISNHLDAKLNAMREHSTELRDHPHPRTVDNVRRNAMLWGAKAGVLAAEPFELLREITTDSPAE